MPKRSTPFQKLILDIQRVLHGTVAQVTESEMLVDRLTNQKTEVDIVVRRKVGPHEIVVCIECTGDGKGKRKLGVEWVREMSAKHQHLPTNKLVLVGKRGFTSRALLLAEKLGHDAIYPENAENCDWKSRVFEISSLQFAHIKLLSPIYALMVFHGSPEPDILQIKDAELSDYRFLTRERKEIGRLDILTSILLTNPDTIRTVRSHLKLGPEDLLPVGVETAQGEMMVGPNGMARPLKNLAFGAKYIETPGTIGMNHHSFANFAVGLGEIKIPGNMSLRASIIQEKGSVPVGRITLSVSPHLESVGSD